MATTWVLCNQAGLAITEFANASTRVFSAQRNQPRQAALTLAHSDSEAERLFALLANGVPQLRYYRDGTLRLSGYLTAIEEFLTDDETRLTATFKDPFGRILGDGSSTGRFLTADVTYTAQDQGAIAWALVDLLNAGDDTGIREGTIEATVARDRTYETGKNVGEALVQLTEVEGGPDIEFAPLDPTEEAGKLAELNVYESQGSAQDDLFWGFGPGTMSNVLQVERHITPPVNRVRLVTSEGLVSIQTDDDSIDRHGELALERVEPNDVTDQATLDRKARALLRPEWVRVLKFTDDPDLSPQPFDDFWLGDFGMFKGVDGAFEEALTVRVNGVSITEDHDGNETHEIEVEA